MIRRPPRSTRTDTLFPYTTLFRSDQQPWRSPMDRIVAGLPVLVSNTIIIGTAVVLALAVHWIVTIILSRAAPRTASGVDDMLLRKLRHPSPWLLRSEARRLGNTCVSQCESRWSPSHLKNIKQIAHLN